MPALRRVLGATFGLAIIIGTTIGGGILHTPGDVAGVLPSAPLIMIAWIIGAVYVVLGATIFAELGAMIPRAGGSYVFVERALSRRAAVLAGYGDWLNYTISISALLLLAGEYVGGLIPPLEGHPMLAGLLAFTVLAIINWIGIKEGGWTQELISALKTLGIVLLIGAALFMPHPAIQEAATTPAIPHGASLLLAFGIAMQGIVFTYDGYYTVVYCAEEMADPGREIPRSIFRGSGLIIALFLLINIAFLHVMPVSRMANDPFVGATLARILFGVRGDLVIRLIMVIAVLGTVNAQMIATPRIALAMARQGIFPRWALKVNAGGTPTGALAITLAVALGFVLTGSYNKILGVDAFLVVAIYLIVFVSFFALRRNEPGTARPYRAPGYPWLPAGAVIFSVGILVAMALGDWKSAAVATASLLVCWPIGSYLARTARPAPTE